MTALLIFVRVHPLSESGSAKHFQRRTSAFYGSPKDLPTASLCCRMSQNLYIKPQIIGRRSTKEPSSGTTRPLRSSGKTMLNQHCQGKTQKASCLRMLTYSPER